MLLPHAVPHIFPWKDATVTNPSSLRRVSRMQKRAVECKRLEEEKEKQRAVAVNDVAMEVTTTSEPACESKWLKNH